MIDIKNKNVILLLSCIILFLVGLSVNDPFDWFSAGYKDANHLLSDFQVANVQKIEVYDNNSIKLNFKRTAAGWQVGESKDATNFRAQNKMVATALEKLAKMRKYREITSNSKKYDDYLVNKQHFYLAIEDNAQKKFTVYLGKSGETFNSTLVRLADDSEVYSVKGTLKSDWNKSLSDFRDKKSFSIVKANIQSITLSGFQNYTIKKSTGIDSWSIVTKKESPAQKSAVAAMLNQIENLEGSRYETANVALKSEGQIEIVTNSNTTIAAEIFKNKKTNDYYIKSTYNTHLMVLSKSKIDAIFVAEDTIIEKAAATTNKGPAN